MRLWLNYTAKFARVEERGSRQTGGDLVFFVVVRINYGITLLCVPAEINDGHLMSFGSAAVSSLMDRDSGG